MPEFRSARLFHVKICLSSIKGRVSLILVQRGLSLGTSSRNSKYHDSPLFKWTTSQNWWSKRDTILSGWTKDGPGQPRSRELICDSCVLQYAERICLVLGTTFIHLALFIVLWIGHLSSSLSPRVAIFISVSTVIHITYDFYHIA